MSLFVASQIEEKLLGPILNYFATIKINNYGMLYFYCLILLKGILYLAILQSQIQNNIEFGQKLLLFLEYIIKCLACEGPHIETLDKFILMSMILLLRHSL